ncbi:MAG: glycerol kinase GlpK [Pirellulales bacterium]|nr:glycerol kinase GlpK [Pirellulales bacterium]
MQQYILALDQGTTSSRAIVFDHSGQIVSVAQREFQQILPSPGNVEHDADEIWASQRETAQQALVMAEIGPEHLAGIGVTNQRETTVLWEKETGRPVHHAIVWQSRVSAPICERLKRDGCEETFRSKTGLLLDPYFSGTKITHLLESVSGLRSRAERGEILFGTIDSWLIWKATGGKLHVTDASNASRTLLLNIHTLQWDDELLKLLDVPRAMLPKVRASSEIYGQASTDFLGAEVPIASSVGDQQAATFGQCCFEPGSAKNTYGTGCFLLLNTGAEAVASQNRLLTTVGWKIGNETTYCLEGSVFIGGAVVQWLRDGLQIIQRSSDVESLAAQVSDADGVFFVPAFVGLGAPHWDPYARGAIFGLTRGTTQAHIARAAMDSMAYQSRDLIACMRKDAGLELTELKVDGGASLNNALMQFQADILDASVRRPVVAETTALGAAYLAGLAVGYWEDQAAIRQNWSLDQEFLPDMEKDTRKRLLTRWQQAVERTLQWES